jgi:hypothetical protein
LSLPATKSPAAQSKVRKQTMEFSVAEEPGSGAWEDKAIHKWASFIRELTSPHDADSIEWTRLNRIVSELGRIGRKLPGEHWAFLPGGGGLAIARTRMTSECYYMQIKSRDGEVYVCNPLSLMCVSFPDAPDFCYFDLQLARLRPRNETTGPRDATETCGGKVRTAGGKTRRADFTRLLRGRIVIFCKASIYNLSCTDQDGRHDLLSRKEFRAWMQEKADSSPY